MVRALIQRGNAVTTRWAPAQGGVDGNGTADPYAKAAAENTADAVNKQRPREVSLTFTSRSTTGTNTNGMAK